MKKIFSIFALIAAVSLNAYAGGRPDVKFVWDVDFETKFDNREFYESSFTRSMTIFGARLTPTVGFSLHEKDGTDHRVMFGLDAMKDFGSDVPIDLLHESLLYYRLDKKIRKTRMELYAGIFPRGAMEGSWSEVFFSDSLKFYDDNLEGILLKFHRPESYYEVGCDWMGQYGDARREKFMIYTSGEGKVLPFMSLGYAGYMLHYANSGIAKGLVDNILVNPYARFDLGYLTDLQTLSFRVGWLQAMQRDREYDGVFVYPCGVEFNQEIRKWNVGILNKVFYGTDMMPYYNNMDNAGIKYGPNLYYGDPFYRIHDEGGKGCGVYDRAELYYEPHIGEFLKLRVSALFHFHNQGYSGCQQMISLSVDINSLFTKNNRK